MEIKISKRVAKIGSYAFAEVDRQVSRLREKGIEPVDFGVGDPTIAPPPAVRDAVKTGVEKHKTAGYPGYIGMSEYRDAISQWVLRRFGVELDPEKEVTSTIGSKEGVFNFAEAFVDPDDIVIIPTPGYPPYTRGTLFAEGRPYYVPLLEENGFLIDPGVIPDEIAHGAKLIWINYPNSPTGAAAPAEFLERMVDFARSNDIIIASDEAYSEIYYTPDAPLSLLQIAREGVVTFQSLSKRSAMTGYRTGWAAGDERIIDAFKKVKTNIDSGTPNFIQEAAIAALSDEQHVERSRKDYGIKRDMMADALAESGLQDCRPDATIYIWQKVPEGYSDLDFATRLLDPDIAVVTTPGTWISDETDDGANPGEGFVRFALVPGIEDTKRAAEKISKAQW